MNIKHHIFNFIVDHHARVNHFPTQAEIRRFFGSLTEDVDLHLEQLQREGLFKLPGNGEGAISIPCTFPPTRRINLSNPSCLEPNGINNPFDRASIGLDLHAAGVALDGDLFAQVVGDDSMSDAGIVAKDVAILKVSPPERGEIVAVMEGTRLVLRRYVVIAGIPHFLAENPLRPDLTAAHDKPTHGVLWCLICTRPNGRSRSAPPIKKVDYTQDGRANLESEFVAMLKSELKKGRRPKGPRSVGTTSSNSQEKRTTKSRKKSADCNRDWLKWPSGITLNDKESSGRSAVFTDEKPDEAYGRARTETFANAKPSAKATKPRTDA